MPLWPLIPTPKATATAVAGGLTSSAAWAGCHGATAGDDEDTTLGESGEEEEEEDSEDMRCSACAAARRGGGAGANPNVDGTGGERLRGENPRDGTGVLLDQTS